MASEAILQIYPYPLTNPIITGNDYTLTPSVGNNCYYFNGIPAGTWTVSADGYNSASVTVTGTSYTDEYNVTLTDTPLNLYGWTDSSVTDVSWMPAVQYESSIFGWYDIAYDGTKFIALSRNGYISTSTDGITWSAAVIKINSGNPYWQSLAYGDGKLVAIPLSSSIQPIRAVAISTDGGETWTVTQVGEFSPVVDWEAITYGNGKFVALSYGGYISTSTDGTTWTSAAYKSNLGSHSWKNIAYGNNMFIAVSSGGYVSTSTDGTTWTAAVQNSDLGNHNWYGALAYDGTKFVIVSNKGWVSTSTDGTTWTASTLNFRLGNNGWNGMAYGDGKFVPIGYYSHTSYNYNASQLFTSNSVPSFGMNLYNNTGIDTELAIGTVSGNGFETANAKYRTFTLPTLGTYNVAYGDGVWIAVKCDNMNMHTTAFRSTDGLNWTAITLPVAEHWWDVAYGGSRFVITSAKNNNAGGEYFLYSVDGTSWTSISSPEQAAWYGVVYANGNFVAANGTSSSSSTNGVSWNTPVTIHSSGPSFYELAYGNGTWLAFSTYIYANTMGAKYSSDNAASWTDGSGSGPSGGSWVLKSAYANNIFAYIEAANKYIHRWDSTATAQGTNAYIDQSLSLRPNANLCAANNKFFNISGNYFAWSADAENWTVENTHLTLPQINDICTDGFGHFVAMPSSNTTGLYITLNTNL